MEKDQVVGNFSQEQIEKYDVFDVVDICTVQFLIWRFLYPLQAGFA